MERALLALLVVRGGQLATQDWLIINLWPERVPREAKSVLQNYVSNLSSALEPTRRPGRPWGVLRRESNGYLLKVESLDCRLFDLLVDRGLRQLRTDNARTAAKTLGRALELWRAEDAFADVEETPDSVRDVAGELAARRLQAIKGCCQAWIDTGRSERALLDLDVQRARHPYDEDLVRLSMLALHKRDMTSDALCLYEAMAQVLRRELGTEPGEALREVHGRLLTSRSTAARTPPHPRRPWLPRSDSHPQS